MQLRATPGPEAVTATIVVTAADGVSMAIGLERGSAECVAEGSVDFTAAKELGERAAHLGPAPVRYDVTVVLDSTTYRGVGVWPDDVDSEFSPCTPLHFTPPLPGR